VRKMLLVIADHDPDYVDMMTAYIRNSEFSSRFIVTALTNRQLLDDFTGNQEEPYTLLADELMLADDVASGGKADVILLSGTGASSSEDGRLGAVYKYQPLNQLLSQVYARCLEKQNDTPSGSSSYKTRVISVYSASGGCGKTVTAVNLARQLARLGRKVFYLNLELFSAASQLMSIKKDGHFAKLLYFIKTGSPLLASKIEAFKQHDPAGKTDCLFPSGHSADLMEMTCGDTAALIGAICSLDMYDDLIIDLESSLHERIMEALDQSATILWIVLDDVQGAAKNRGWWEDYGTLYPERYDRLLGKTRFIRNRHIGPTVNAGLDGPWTPAAELPYIPQWKTAASGAELTASPVFNERVAGLASLLSGNEGPS
jgi:hypothetical protein